MKALYEADRICFTLDNPRKSQVGGGMSMAVLLFVHGVATRAGKDYDEAVKARGRRFRETAFAGV